jgi:hypothetical protein
MLYVLPDGVQAGATLEGSIGLPIPLAILGLHYILIEGL